MVETEDHEGNHIAEVQEVENAFSTEFSDELFKKKLGILNRNNNNK